MAKTDPIIGRYVYVPYAGKEYRVYYEERSEEHTSELQSLV